MGSLGVPELTIIALIALLLFGGSRLAGIGKNAGKAIREFKEETSALNSGTTTPPADSSTPTQTTTPTPAPAPEPEKDPGEPKA